MVPQSSDRNLTPLDSTVGELLAAADLVIERGYAMPGLILLYSLVDTMAWLSLPEGVEDVKGTDFIGWVRTYGLEQRVAPCTADELYGARCGLLHSFSPDSRRSRRGEIRPIYYVWGGAGRELLQGEIDKRGDSGIALHIADLRNGIVTAIDSFRRQLVTDAKLSARVRRRSYDLFGRAIPEPYAALLRARLGQKGEHPDGPPKE